MPKHKVSYMPKDAAQTPEGDIGAHRGEEAYELGTFSGCETMTKEKAGWKPMRDHTKIDEPWQKFKGKERD